MAGKRYTAEQIIGHLRQAEIRIPEGKTVAEVVRELGVSEQTYYRWRKEYGGMKVEQLRRLSERGLPGKLLSPTRRRQAVVHVRETLAVSERRACRVLGQVRRTQRYTLKVTDDETILTESIVSLASEYGRYGYRRITALLRRDGWRVNHKRGRLWFVAPVWSS